MKRMIGSITREEYEKQNGGQHYVCCSSYGCDDLACHQCYPDPEDLDEEGHI